MHTIAYVNHSGKIGGAENSLIELLRRLPGTFRPVVICPPDGTLAQRLKAMDVTVETLPLVRFKRSVNPLQLARYYVAWRRLTAAVEQILLRENAAIVHSNSTTAHLYGGLAAARLGVPSVWHVRDAAIPFLAAKLLPKASACIAISRYIAEQVRAKTGVEAQVIYNGVDVEVFHPPEDGHLNHLNGGTISRRPTVAMIGQIFPWKGQMDFISMAAEVRKMVPDARFLIIGEDMFNDHPRYRRELAERMELLGLRDVVEFCGYRDDVAELLHEIDVLAVPSRYEGFGRVIVEAMAAGVPVAAYDEGGPREIIEHERTGLLVPPGDAGALSSAVTRLLRDSETAAAFAAAARKEVVSRFESARTAQAVVEVYERLLEARG